MNSTKKTARLAGLLWLLTAVTGGFGLFYIRTNILVPGDAAATAGNILASEFIYRTAIVSILVAQVFMFFFGLTLVRLFKGVNEHLTRVILASVILTVGIAVLNTFNHFAALMILSGADFLKVFSTEQLNAMALTLVRLANSTGQGLIEIFWAPYYFSFGLLVIKSKSLPKIIGIFLMIMGVGFAVNILQKFLFPPFHPVMFTQLAMLGGALGGLPTMFWLLIKGAKVQPTRSDE